MEGDLSGSKQGLVKLASFFEFQLFRSDWNSVSALSLNIAVLYGWVGSLAIMDQYFDH
jgi:hypothetical protein